MFSILTEEHYQKKIKLNPSGAYKLSVKAAFLSFFFLELEGELPINIKIYKKQNRWYDIIQKTQNRGKTETEEKHLGPNGNLSNLYFHHESKKNNKVYS